jgi:hypothetical protein
MSIPSSPPGGVFALTEQQKQRILQELDERGAKLPCARCGNTNFTLLDALSLNSLGDGKTVSFVGPAIPAAVVICVKCGAIYQHAVGVLGLFGDLGITAI